MFSERPPKVSLGMPVFNAERYLPEAIDSLLAQTFDDFEIVISDNASTDRTEEICRMYAEKDERIRYFRQRANYGMIANFNMVFQLSRGEYFKWCASDDICAPDNVARAVEVLESDPTIVLAFPLIVGIEEDGKRRNKQLPGQVFDRDTPATVSSPDPVVRFRKMMRHMWWVDAMFYGLMRANALGETALHPYHVNGDHLLVAELVLKGRFYEIPEELFFSRYHAKSTSVRQKSGRDRVQLIENRTLSRLTGFWKVLKGYPSRIATYLTFVRQTDLSHKQRWTCYYEVIRTLGWWTRLRLYGFLKRWHDFSWLRPNYPRS